VRYPFSPTDEKWNEQMWQKYPTHEAQVKELNDYVVKWLQGPSGINFYTRLCLQQPKYNAFSNTTSGGASLENPHNMVHVAVGGNVLSGNSLIQGDMALVETSGFDPIFYFHHCNVDRLFWVWQKKYNHRDTITVDESNTDEGTYGGAQGATPGIPLSEQLTIDSPLYPFQLPIGTPFTFKDVVNAPRLGIDYSLGSYDTIPSTALSNPTTTFVPVPKQTVFLVVENIDKTKLKGTFVISFYAQTGADKRKRFARHAVFARTDSSVCDNCKTHKLSSAFIAINSKLFEGAGSQIEIEVHSRDGKLPLSHLGPTVRWRVAKAYVGEGMDVSEQLNSL